MLLKYTVSDIVGLMYESHPERNEILSSVYPDYGNVPFEAEDLAIVPGRLGTFLPHDGDVVPIVASASRRPIPESNADNSSEASEPVPRPATEHAEATDRIPAGETDAQPETLPAFEIVGATPSPELQRYISQTLQITRETTSFAGETPLTAEEQATLEDARVALLAEGRTLGLDLSERVLAPEYYRLFDRQEAFERAAGRLSAGRCDGLWTPAIGVLLLRQEDQADQAILTVHETGHSLSHVQVRPAFPATVAADDPERHYKVKSLAIATGYGSDPDTAPGQEGIDELAANLLADRAVIRLINEDRLAPPRTININPINIIGDAVIRRAASAHGLEPQEVENMFVRGFLNGDSAALELVDQTLGPEAAGRFKALVGDESIDEALRAADQMGLQQAITPLEQFRAREPFGIFEWRPTLLHPLRPGENI